MIWNLQLVRHLYNIIMECLFPKKEKEEDKKNWLEERRNIRKYSARLNAILDEDYDNYEDYKKRCKLWFKNC